MCFVITDETPKIATKDIVCYKTGFKKDEQLQSACGYMYYDIDIENPKVELFINFDEVINEGYHSGKTIEDASHYIFDSKGKFIIPKGTKYYENETEYVSETIIFKGFIK